jgi:hypothetical protein
MGAHGLHLWGYGHKFRIPQKARSKVLVHIVLLWDGVDIISHIEIGNGDMKKSIMAIFTMAYVLLLLAICFKSAAVLGVAEVLLIFSTAFLIRLNYARR